MMYSSIPLAQSIVKHCEVNGIKNIVLSPGSRNAPLIIGFSENPFFKCFSIVDERCAAFFALGMAQNLKEPVVVVCTSGSALLNYYPAIAEAFYSDIPLIVISADRPTYKIDVGDGQTIRQDNVFDRHIGYSANLKQDVSHATERVSNYVPEWISEIGVKKAQSVIQNFNDNELNQAFNISRTSNSPVHINAPFEEPLYDVKGKGTVTPNVVISSAEILPEYDFNTIQEEWKKAKRKMILVGVNMPNEIDQDLLNILADDPSVIVFTETTSNLHHTKFFPSIDSIIAPIEKSEDKDILFNKLQPEILLTFGGLIVSKKIKAFLRAYKPKKHWHVNEKKAFNTFFALSNHYKLPINQFLNQLLAKNEKTNSSYFDYWNTIKLNYQTKRKEYIKNASFSDLKAFNILLDSIPGNYQLQLANSSTVRYVQLFNINKSLEVFCNRGTSGIDGSTSTAIGASIYNKTPTVLITGDLSFFYDSNGLWNSYIKNSFRIILINNSGGGIFRILPGNKKSSEFENYFETSHNLNAKGLCEMYDFEYYQASDETTLDRKFKKFYNVSDKPKLMEINTPRLKNDKILMDYFNFIS